MVGTPYYMSPELIAGISQDARANDMWALGCTLLELVVGKPPWSSFGFENVASLMTYVGHARTHPPLPSDISLGFQDVLYKCFCVTPSERVTAKDLLRHPWVSPNEFPPLAPPSVAGGAAGAPDVRPDAAVGPTGCGVVAASSNGTDEARPLRAIAPSVATGPLNQATRGDDSTPTRVARHRSAYDVSVVASMRSGSQRHDRGSVTEPEDEDEADNMLGYTHESTVEAVAAVAEVAFQVGPDPWVRRPARVVSATSGPVSFSDMLPSHLSGASSLATADFSVTGGMLASPRRGH